MSKKVWTLMVGGLLCCGGLGIWYLTPKTVEAAKLIDLVQSHYGSLRINDKMILEETSESYLIDDFIPKLSRYTLKEVRKADYTPTYEVVILHKDGTLMTLMDNEYLTINDKTYEIVMGSLDLEKFYGFIE